MYSCQDFQNNQSMSADRLFDQPVRFGVKANGIDGIRKKKEKKRIKMAVSALNYMELFQSNFFQIVLF